MISKKENIIPTENNGVIKDKYISSMIICYGEGLSFAIMWYHLFFYLYIFQVSLSLITHQIKFVTYHSVHFINDEKAYCGTQAGFAYSFEMKKNP